MSSDGNRWRNLAIIPVPLFRLPHLFGMIPYIKLHNIRMQSILLIITKKVLVKSEALLKLDESNVAKEQAPSRWVRLFRYYYEKMG